MEGFWSTASRNRFDLDCANQREAMSHKATLKVLESGALGLAAMAFDSLNSDFWPSPRT